MKTLYVDTFEYKHTKLRSRYLQAGEEYLKYLRDLVYRRYDKYLNNIESNKTELTKELISNKQLESDILSLELKVAEINKRLNPYYAINELIIYNPFSSDEKDVYQLYEPSIGRKVFKTQEETEEYKKLNRI